MYCTWIFNEKTADSGQPALTSDIHGAMHMD